MLLGGTAWMLIGFALALAVTYAIFFTNRFKPGIIIIYHLTRPSGMQCRRAGMARLLPSRSAWKAPTS